MSATYCFVEAYDRCLELGTCMWSATEPRKIFYFVLFYFFFQSDSRANTVAASVLIVVSYCLHHSHLYKKYRCVKGKAVPMPCWAPHYKDRWVSGGIDSPILNPTLNRGEWPSSRPGRLFPDKYPPIVLDWRYDGGSKSRSECGDDQKNTSSFRDLTAVVQPVAWSV